MFTLKIYKILTLTACVKVLDQLIVEFSCGHITLQLRIKPLNSLFAYYNDI